MEKEKMNQAERNAEGHAESIIELYRAYTALENGAESARADGCEFTSSDRVLESATESALDVSVRADWHNPGKSAEPDEFMILLTTGGPALRIIGDLDRGCPENPHFEIQDWGTPWTEYHPNAESEDDWEDAIDWFVSCFYYVFFGE